MADLFIRGLPLSITARYFSSNPSDSGSLRTPCPPPTCAAGRQGITPAFGYSAPHPSAEGTLTLLIHALPSAHYALFWLTKRGTYTAGSVDGVYVQMDMRTNDPNMKFVADVGADWYLDASVGVGRDFANVSGAGQSNWVELTTQWSTLRFYSWSAAQLQADPPPPLDDSLVETKQTITRRRAHTSSSCRSAS